MIASTRSWFQAFIVASLSLAACATATASAREEGRLLTATEVLEDVQGMPDQRLPDLLLSRAYGIAIIPDVVKVGLTPVGGSRGKGVLMVRDKLDAPWSNPSFITLTGGNLGFMIGVQSSDIVLVFTTKSGIEGITGGKMTLGANASVAAGPVGRSGSAGTDLNFDSEIYSYARSRGLFAGAALDGTVLSIDKKSNAAFYGKSGVSASEIFSGQSPAPPAAGQRFLDRLAQVTRTSVRSSPAPQAEVPAGAPPPAASGGAAPAPAAPATPATPPAPAQTFPMEDSQAGQEPPK
ncbi:MAG: lipid-binding SYLF domain-containing protein [Steroidobacteraceae bacterium]